MRIEEIVSDAKYRKDEQFQNLTIFSLYNFENFVNFYIW